MLTKRYKSRNRSLRLETLEDRSMMAAGITAALSNLGVLTVNGTTGNDTIVFHRANNQIYLDGVTTKFAAAQVKSIVVNPGAGDDVIRLNSAATVGQQALNVPVTVISGAGNDDAKLPDGRDVYFSGLGHTLSVLANGSATLDNKSLTWFDTNVHDDGLRTLAKSYFSDNVLGRDDMLKLFRKVETYGTVSTVVMADLQAIVKTSTLFGSLNYVQVLSSDIVLGNTANAKYLGQALGNLKVGSGATQLENLVGKWFLGKDHPLGKSDWGPTYAYMNAAGKLFAHPPVYTDIAQGGCGDCYYLASLAEAALKNPSLITNMFVVNGDGTYTVRFFHAGKAEYVTVDSQLPVDQYGRLVFNGMGLMANNANNTLWGALAEKAYAQMNESGWLRPGLSGNGQNSYIGISGGYINVAMAQITGQAISATAYVTSTNFSAFATAFNAGKMIELGTFSNPSLSTIVGGHAYAVAAVDTVHQTVTVYNPWGLNNGSNKPGLVTLTWAQMTTNFQVWNRTM